MKLIIENTKTRVTIGGADNLLDIDLQKELEKLLRVRPKVYGMTPAYRSGRWDGYMRLLTKANFFPTGLLEVVIKLGEKVGAIIEIEDNRANKVEFLPIPTEVAGLTLRPYQLEVVQKTVQNMVGGLQYPRGVWDLATNSGKTLMITALMKSIKDLKVIYLVDRIKNFNDSLKWFKFVFGDSVGVVAGKKLELDKAVVVAKAGTLVNKVGSLNTKKALKLFNMVVVDEAHRAGNDTFKKILKYIDAYVRIMQSGTPLDIDCDFRKISIVAQSGKVLHKVTNQQLIDLGVSLKPTVKVFSNPIVCTRVDYAGAYEEIVVYSEHRLKNIAEVIQGANKSVLISVRLIEHGKHLKTELDKVFKNQLSIEYIHSQDEFLQDKIEEFSTGEIKVLIDTGILKESANIPIINTFINAAGGKSTVGLKQYYGRGSRTNGTDTGIELYDFFDIDIIDSAVVFAKHSRKRLQIWKDEGFEVTLDYLANSHGTPKI